MLDKIFKGLFDTTTTESITVGTFFICVGVAIAMGIMLAFLYTAKSKSSKSFFITLSILPAVVCVVIMMVNGNLGAGVAVAGAFSLVRFRSAPGSAKEIAAIFLAMGAGLIIGMGYIGYGVLFSIILGLMMFILGAVGKKKNVYTKERTLKITIPEDLNYTKIFDDIFAQFTEFYELTQVKTTNLGSLYKLTYNVKLKNNISEEEMIDNLRVRNGNLEISLCRQEIKNDEL